MSLGLSDSALIATSTPSGDETLEGTTKPGAWLGTLGTSSLASGSLAAWRAAPGCCELSVDLAASESSVRTASQSLAHSRPSSVINTQSEPGLPGRGTR